MGRSSLETKSNIEATCVGLENGGVLASIVYLSNGRPCQRRNRSRTWRSKSLNEQIIILPLTSVDRVLSKKSILKKGDISRNQVPTKTMTLTPIPLLKSRVTKEDMLQ